MRAETAEPLFQPPLPPRELGLRSPRSHASGKWVVEHVQRAQPGHLKVVRRCEHPHRTEDLLSAGPVALLAGAVCV